jgi:hypothetical protein
MPKNVQELCHDTLDAFIKMGVLKDYVRSGRFRMPRVKFPIIPAEQWEILHYADCEGPLYRSDRDWALAFRIVSSFTRRGQREAELSCHFPNIFGEIPGTGVTELLDELPIAFARVGFQTLQKSPVTRSAIFVASGSVKMSKLPEPFGKYWQIKKSTPRWNEDVQLELQSDVKLTATPAQSVVLDLTLSAAALPVAGLLASELGRQLKRHLASPMPHDLWRSTLGRGGAAPARALPVPAPGSGKTAQNKAPAGVRRMRSF